MDDVPSREELRKSKVVELRQKLSEAGLPQTGKALGCSSGAICDCKRMELQTVESNILPTCRT